MIRIVFSIVAALAMSLPMARPVSAYNPQEGSLKLEINRLENERQILNRELAACKKNMENARNRAMDLRRRHKMIKENRRESRKGKPIE